MAWLICFGLEVLICVLFFRTMFTFLKKDDVSLIAERSSKMYFQANNSHDSSMRNGNEFSRTAMPTAMLCVKHLSMASSNGRTG